MTDPASNLASTAHLLRLLGDTLHVAATTLEAGDERRTQTLLRAIHDAVNTSNSARDWDQPQATHVTHQASPQDGRSPTQDNQDQQGGEVTHHTCPDSLSPWGRVLTQVHVLPGVTYITTERHGGYHLEPEVNGRIPEEVRQSDGYYEQDIQGALCAYFVPFTEADESDVLLMIETHYPQLYARIVRGAL